MANIDIEKIKNDEKQRNDFISSYKPFIASCVYSIINKRVQYGVDEELSVALLAFNHAIDKYDGRGSFLSFAKLVIRNRLYDYFRTSDKHSYEGLYNDDETENYNVIEKSIAIYNENDDVLDLRAEIRELNKMLLEVNIKFSELVLLSPKHKKKREKINSVVKYILSNEEAMKYFSNSKNLPLKLIEDNLDMPRKNIESYRKYIVALLIIATSDLYFLKEYLSI